MSEPALKCESNDSFEQINTLKLFIAFKMAYSCCFSFGGNLDFPEFLQRKFYNINYWRSSEHGNLTVVKVLDCQKALFIGTRNLQICFYHNRASFREDTVDSASNELLRSCSRDRIVYISVECIGSSE